MKKTQLLIGAALLLLTTLAWAGAQPEESQGPDRTLSGEVEIVLPGGYYYDFIKTQIKPYFERQYPQVSIRVAQEGGSGTSGTDKIQARVAAGDAPDIYVGVFGYQPAQYAKMGRLAELETLPGAAELLERIKPIFITRDFGHVYYIPWNATTQLMIYNTALFEEAALDAQAPPATLAEFLSTAAKINTLPDREGGDKVYGNIFWNEALNWGGWYWTMLAQIYYNFNNGRYQLFNPYGTDIVFDRPEAGMAEFFAFLREAQNYAPPTMEKNFFTRSVGMWLQFGFGWKANLKEAKDYPMEIGVDVGVAPIPVSEPGQPSWSTLDGRSLMVFKSNPVQEGMAWELVKFLMRADKNLEACKALGQLPTLKALERDPFFELPEHKPFVRQLEHTLINEPIAELGDVANELQKAIAAVVLDQSLSPAQGVAQAAAKARELLKAK